MSEEARRVFEALGELEKIADTRARALALGEVLKQLPQHNKRLKKLRQQAVQELLAREGASLRTVGADLGVSFSTVQDIAKGYSSSGSRRPKKGQSQAE
ncbi:helix-turn-helix domain-containing protein [Streptomyces sp. AV19]|uniref:helix-turn-helix domain-containing protein n=1 Tax=Streptomyces sp. AV19 TaxID=2793068 RepID=UPI0018FE1397|nr:helix-turn-helix domain-containing protein [Streptomyces sp. AV19]MBH1938953.1 helix-turn-helix domain-containing protein [Streptomyces sp. AV19]MDG4531637.1 helix-turn-helix domain-containing protein [Streptomyces sp. AV19]